MHVRWLVHAGGSRAGRDRHCIGVRLPCFQAALVASMLFRPACNRPAASLRAAVAVMLAIAALAGLPAGAQGPRAATSHGRPALRVIALPSGNPRGR